MSNLWAFVEDNEDFEKEMVYARNTLWMFGQDQDEETRISGFALPSKVLRETGSQARRRLVLDLEALPMVEYHVQTGGLRWIAPDLRTFLLGRASNESEDIWNWMIDRQLLRGEDREMWEEKIRTTEEAKETEEDEDEDAEVDNSEAMEVNKLVKKAFAQVATEYKQLESESQSGHSCLAVKRTSSDAVGSQETKRRKL